MPFARLATLAVGLTAIAAGGVAADHLPPEERQPPRPAHTHQHTTSVGHADLQDEVIITSGPLRGVRARVLALQHRFFDAEVWAELLTLEPDANGHLLWIMAPACAIRRLPT